MATYTTSFPGNIALQEEVWTLTMAEAKAAIPLLDTRKGSYWDTVLVQPIRRAVRAKAGTVRVITAGFASGELSNVLCASGSIVTA